MSRLSENRLSLFNLRRALPTALLFVSACAGSSWSSASAQPVDEDTSLELSGFLTPESESAADTGASLSLSEGYETLRDESTDAPYTEPPGWFAELDPLSWYAAVEQTPPKMRHRMKKVLFGRPFPGFPVAYIRAFDRGWGDYAGFLEDDCDFLTDKGTLCPQVIAPGKTLSDKQQARLLAIVENPPELQRNGKYATSRPSYRCAEEAASAFIFYDSKDTPRGIVILTTGCLSWAFQPSISPRRQGIEGLFDEERSAIRALCNELDLTGCRTHGTIGIPRQDSAGRSRRLLNAVFKPPPTIDLSKPISETTSAERRLLCVWAWRGIQTASIAFESSIAPPGIVFTESGNSEALQMLSIEQCIERFPVDCPNTTGQGLEGLHTLATALADGRVVFPPTCLFGIASTPASADE